MMKIIINGGSTFTVSSLNRLSLCFLLHSQQSPPPAANQSQLLWPTRVCVCVCVPHLEGPLHGDGEVVLSARVPALADEHLVADTTRLPSLLGVQLSTNHLRRNVPGLLRPEQEQEEKEEEKHETEQQFKEDFSSFFIPFPA